MVAYSFQRRFVEPILAGTKRQTIRADRRRHARPGEALQLYVGMRTRQCRKIIPDPVCTFIMPISLTFGCSVGVEGAISPGFGLPASDLDAFAVRDGFESWPDLKAFWAEHHPGVERFEGVLIRWEPR